MTTIEDEITELSARWYAYVNHDHHKDRDCHWYITKRWSYGNAPYYVASHYGYRADNWTSPKCVTAQAAHVMLRDFLKGGIAEAINYTQSELDADEPTITGFGIWADREQLTKELKKLKDTI